MFDYSDAVFALPGSTQLRQRMVRDALEYLDNLSQDAPIESFVATLAAAIDRDAPRLRVPETIARWIFSAAA